MADPRGYYRKFEVRRVDGGSDPGNLHEHCEYFTIDLTHDRHAVPALLAYAESCQIESPLLASDLRAICAKKGGA